MMSHSYFPEEHWSFWILFFVMKKIIKIVVCTQNANFSTIIAECGHVGKIWW